MEQNAKSTAINRCRRCNRQLKDPSAQYGWRCAEILGVAQSLNYAGDGAFHAYMMGMKEAEAFLRKNHIDPKKIDLAKFYESFIKQCIAAEANDKYILQLAYVDMMDALSPRCDAQGNLISAPARAPSIADIMNARDRADYQNGKYSTTAFTNNRFDPNVHRLQRTLNANGATDRFGNPLKEDGVLGPRTQWAADFVRASIPSTNYINPLQTKITNVGYRAPLRKDGITKQYQLYDLPSHQRLLEFDKHQLSNAKGTKIPDALHMNVETPKGASKLQTRVAKAINHKPIPEPVYEAFKNFDDVKNNVKTAGKALAAVGVVLDAYEIGSAVYFDLNDEDKKIGKKTWQTSVGIVGSYAGSAGGAKLGAMGGAALGTLICPGLGTLIGGFIGGIAGGYAGASGGRALGEYIIDEAYKGD